MIKSFKLFKEVSSYYSPDESGYNITIVKRDDLHDYKYCDGVLYELSLENNDEIVDIDKVSYTDENLFYDEQIQRYVNYIQNGGIIQTFPVSSHPIGHCYNLKEILEYLDDSDNFDLMYNLLKKHHGVLYDNLSEIIYDENKFGLEIDFLEQIENEEDLDKEYNDSYGENDENLFWNEELYLAFGEVLKYWKENKEYYLTDFNHRFAALKQLGKKKVIVDPN
jgi:hypothetical protein